MRIPRTLLFLTTLVALMEGSARADQYSGGPTTPDHELLQNLRAEDPVTFGILQYNTATMLSHAFQPEWSTRAGLIADHILALGEKVDIITFNEIMTDETRNLLIERLARNGPFHFFT